jgi:GNAT superfamily N-acetyltransferase
MGPVSDRVGPYDPGVATLLRPDGIVIDDDRARVDVDAVHRFLSEESYWAKGRDRETVARLIVEATRVVAAFDDGRQVGFARCFSDRVTTAWINDVYIESTHRGRRIGEDLVRWLIEGSEFPTIRWMLGTRDAHTFYAKLGFGVPGPLILERPPERLPPPA